MCGVVGYIGNKQAEQILVSGLKRLEYRGYDSAGVAILSDKLRVVKSKGKIANLEEKLKEVKPQGEIGIGHTRWATHGEPSDINSHPHTSTSGVVTVVHNGIIENYFTLKTELISKGYKFVSETDTEVIANLIDYYYQDQGNKNQLEVISKALKDIDGSYALGIIFEDNKDMLYGAKNHSPLVVGIGEDENFLVSDVAAVLEHTKNYYILEEKEIVTLTQNDISIYDINLKPIQKEVYEVDWDISAAEKGGYDHFMIKEIYEQPKAIRDTISPRIKDGKIDLVDINLTDEEIKNINKIHVIACGSATHAGMVGKSVIERLARIPVEIHLASEFRYNMPILSPNDLCIIISQSGETADTLAALRYAKKQGIATLGIVNVLGSAIARESDNVLYTWAGPEIAVATTKAYSSQLSVIYLLAIKFASVRGSISVEREEELIVDLQSIPDKILAILEKEEEIKNLSVYYKNADHAFLIGRGLDYSAVVEGSLKLKEISYIHSEAYAAGELKHGSIALIEKDTLVIAVATQKGILDKTVSNLNETKARGADTILIIKEGEKLDYASNKIITVPSVDELFTASLTAIPLQLFAYHVSVARDCDIDMPRNLAKSVTVE